MRFHEYNPDADRAAVQRIWREIGWMDATGEELLDLFLTGGRTWVAEIGDQPECLVQTVAASVRYLEEELPASVVSVVTTSHVARQQGLATRPPCRR